MDKRRLHLRRETLAELDGGDLQAVVGAAPELSGRTCPAAVCVVDVSRLFHTCGCESGMC